MSNKIVFTYTKAGVNKGKIKCVDGWYHVNVGKFNAFNVGGELYLVDGLREVINDPNSRVGQKLAMGYLKGEREHPEQKPNMTKAEYLMRLIHIDPKNISHHIKSIEFEDTGIPTGRGFSGNIINCTAWIKPDAGPLGQILKHDLDDPEINVAFSLRSIITSANVNGVQVNKIKTFVTFDWVFMPGMDTANKWDTKDFKAGNNSVHFNVDQLQLEDHDIQLAMQVLDNSKQYVGTESTDLKSVLEEIKKIEESSRSSKSFRILNDW